MDTNVLYYGDNLDILRRYIPDESVDLVYLDPPFNSNRDYNVIFKDESGRKSDAQLLAFEDTWHWGPAAEETYRYLTNTAYHGGKVPSAVSQIVAALRAGVGTNQMMAYLVEMAVRLVELHRVLTPTGLLYLHCDTTASHYLKLVLDAIFSPRQFRNEIVWCYTGPSAASRDFPRKHDVILRYSRSDGYYSDLDAVRIPYKELHSDKGKHPRIWGEGGGSLQDETVRQQYISRGKVPEDFWLDIPSGGHISPRERLGYPTQKPVKLLERIITASCPPDGVVLDPFCGCGTALVAAHRLGRHWIGIDITYLSIAVMKARLRDAFEELSDVPVIGQPTEVEGARQLAQSPEGRYQFQWWALGLVDAKPLGGTEKKGADRGIDGLITFTDKNAELQSVIVSVKSGHVQRRDVADLKNSVEREKAAIGLFITLEEPTKEMRLEATTAGVYHSELWNRDYPRIQLLSIRELLEEHKKPQLPPFVLPTFQQAQRERRTDTEQQEMFGQGL